MSHRISTIEWVYAQDTERFAGLIRSHRECDMSEKTLRPTSDQAEPVSLSRKPKRGGVVNDSNDRTSSNPRVRLLDMPTKHAVHCHLRIRKEPI
jgi:hypothetical protein